MARQKGASSASKATTPSKSEGSINASADILKTFGDGVVINGQHLLDNPKEVISVSPALDAALGGGLQVGSMVTLAGQPRTGKTSTALHFASNWQATGRKVVYLNAEHRLEERNLKGTSGLKPEEVTVIQSAPGKILTAQDFLSIALTYLTLERDLLVIIDSISILSEEREVVGGIGTETRGGSGKLVAQFCRLATPVIPVNGHIVIGMAHLYSNTSGQGHKKFHVSMGKKADYALSTSLYCEYAEPWTIGTGDKKTQIGQINHWKVERSPIGPPNEKADSYLRYDSGLDEVREVLQFAEDLKIIEVNGAWYYYPEKEGARIKGQGFEQFRENLLADETAWTEVQERVAELNA